MDVKKRARARTRARSRKISSDDTVTRARYSTRFVKYGISRMRKLKSWEFLLASNILGLFSSVAFASGFQLWEQDAASIGNYHAGIAAEAADASTAFYNPAGLVRIPNQQFVLGTDVILPSIKYTGTVNVNTLGNTPL